MGSRKITKRKAATSNIAAMAWYIKSKGMLVTGEKFAYDVYDYFLKLANNRKSYRIFREPARAELGYKCIPYKKKYTIVLIE